jgi:ABC-type multidrug transport system ATPase subunit
MELKQIYDVNNLKLTFKSKKVLEINTLKFHNGLIYGICGNLGSGKSSLLKVLSAEIKQSSGEVLYQGKEFTTNFFGKIRKEKDIAYIHVDLLKDSSTVESFIKSLFGKKSEKIKSNFFTNSGMDSLWRIRINNLSDGEKHWLKMVIALEKDPRVLLVDDYGLFLDFKSESLIRKKIIKMNNYQGTTIILSSTTDFFLKQFCNVIFYLDNGHISKVRKGDTRRKNRN